MTNGEKILSVIATGLLIYIIFLNGCSKRSFNDGAETIISIDTVRYETVYDTTWYDTTTFKYVTVETPKIRYVTKYIYDTIPLPVYSQEDFDQLMRYPAIYEDSMIKDDTVHLTYKATVRGYLDKIQLGYKIVKPLLIAKTTTIETEIIKIKRPWSIYAGLDAAANSDGLTHLAPMIELVMPKIALSGGYDLNDQAFVIGAKVRISFRRKPKAIPRP